VKTKIEGKTAFFAALIALLVLTMGMFWDVLFTNDQMVLSSSSLWTDLSSQFAHWRQFGFDEIRNGNLPLWNPHVFSGMPYFPGFQSALLYPLNVVYLLLPLHKAINVGMALHVFLGGVFVYLWASQRKLHPLACFLAASEFMFCGPHFLHIYAGHLPNLCSLIWVPLLFLSIDGLFEKKSLWWCFLGIFAGAMQILAGHPQYVFYTGVAATIYTGIRIIWAENRLKIAASYAGIYVGAIVLAAVQLFPAIEAAEETIRGTGVSYEFASIFSFPPENLLTWFVPGFFGDMVNFEYWGRWLLWEMCLFISVTGICLAVYAVVFGTERERYILLVMVLILMMLALGAHTPLFRLLYEYVPGFNKFRGSSKFTLQATVFLIMLSATGLDLIIRNGVRRRKTLIGLFLMLAVAGVIFAHGLRLSALSGQEGNWHQILKDIFQSTDPLRSPGFFSDKDSVTQAGLFAANNIIVFAGVCLLVSTVVFLSRFHHKVLYLLILLGLAELFVFARTSKETFQLLAPPRKLTEFVVQKSADYRVLNLSDPNSAMSIGALDIWGSDPGVLRRYAEFMAFTQGQNPEEVTQHLQVNRRHRLYNMLRCRYGIIRKLGQTHLYEISRDVMPRFTLIRDWRVVTGRDRVFSLMNDTTFDPSNTVILERDPRLPKPETMKQKGVVTLVNSSTDHLTIQVDLPKPAVLLVTDAYSEGWRAYPLKGSIQEAYDVLPANYTLRAIPLIAGHHHFRLEYLPRGFLLGKWVSILGVCTYLGGVVWFWRRNPNI
jgi:hypothetical protein